AIPSEVSWERVQRPTLDFLASELRVERNPSVELKIHSVASRSSIVARVEHHDWGAARRPAEPSRDTPVRLGARSGLAAAGVGAAVAAGVAGARSDHAAAAAGAFDGVFPVVEERRLACGG